MTHRFPEPAPAPARVALFTGTFNPFTLGHASIVERALPLFSRIIISVGFNPAKAGDGCDSAQSRADAIRSLYAKLPPGRVQVVASPAALTVDTARALGAGWLLRGVRSVKDFEYERDMADLNRRLSGIETVILFTLPELAAVSSSVVREIQSFGHDVSGFLPTPPDNSI